MGEEIFRKKSLDKMKSPDNLDDYIQVSNPGVWLVLASVIILLIGACVWGVFGHIDRTVSAAVYVENGKAVCYIADSDISSIHEGMTVTFDDIEAVICKISKHEDIEYVCSLWSEQVLQDGFYEGKVVTKSFRPLSLVLN